jgi:hypothetical protein
MQPALSGWQTRQLRSVQWPEPWTQVLPESISRCAPHIASRALLFCARSNRQALPLRRWFGEEEMGGARLERATFCL